MLHFILAKLLFLTLAGSLVSSWLLICSWIFHKHLSHRIKYYMWMAAIFAFLIPLGPVHTAQVVNTSRIAAPEISALSENQQPADPAPLPPQMQNAAPMLQAAAAQVMNPPRLLPDFRYQLQNTWLVLFAGVWLGVGFCLFVKKRMDAIWFRRKLTPMLQPPAPEIYAIFKACKQQLHIRGNVRLRTMNTAVSPFLTGLFRPTVVIPVSIASKDLYLVFCHELTHYRRRDLWYGLLTELVCQLHWFNPLVWVIAEKRRLEMEFSCDEAVSALLDENQKKAYIIAILTMMRNNSYLKKNSACLSESGMNIKKRLEVIMKHRKNKYSILSTMLGAVMLSTSVVSVYAVNSQNPITSAYMENHANSHSYFSYSRRCDPSEYGIDDSTGYTWGTWNAELINTPLNKSFTASASLNSYMLQNANQTVSGDNIIVSDAGNADARKTKQADIQVKMTEFTEAISDGYIWKGKFTVTINGTPVMENTPGCINNVPAAQSRGYTSIGIMDIENNKSVYLKNIRFSHSGTDQIDAAAYESKYYETLYNSPTKMDINLSKIVNLSYNGQEFSFPEDSKSVYMYSLSDSLVADPASQKVYLSVPVHLYDDAFNCSLTASPYDSYTVTDDTVSGVFYLDHIQNTHIDCFRGTFTGLSDSSDTVFFRSDDGRFTLESRKMDLADNERTQMLGGFSHYTHTPENRAYTEEIRRAVNLEDLPFTVMLEPDNQHITIAYKQNTGIQRWHTAIATYNFNGNDIYETRASSHGDSSAMTLPLLTDGSRHYIYAQTSQYEPYAIHTTYDISFNIVDNQLYFTSCSADTKENKAISGYSAVLLWNDYYIHD